MAEENTQNQIQPENNKTDAPVGIVETYVGDMADVIGSGEDGLVRKIIHEEEGFEKEKKNFSPESKRNKIFMFSGLALIFLAVAIVSFFIFKNRNAATVSITPQFVPLIFSEKSTPLEIAEFKKDEIAQTVLNEINKIQTKKGTVEGIYLTENGKTIGLRRFISLIGASFFPSDNTTFIQDGFLVGSVFTGVKASNPFATDFFILIKVRSNTDIFDSLHSWEKTMLTDLHGFLGVNISSDTDYLFKKNFEDSVVQNKNARVLYDKDGNVVLMYIFANDNSIVITDDKDAAKEIMLRLAASQTSQ